ncbi:MAG: LptF/LptG family permease [Phycisphaerales bacterium]|nr:LptF/LptG family permease [Phycisphaerales bacterium]
MPGASVLGIGLRDERKCVRIEPLMSRILFRSILLDILRVFTLTTAVLVAVIAFGAAIRPIIQNLLGPDELLQYVAMASIPMLQFAIPFAAAFAGTIVYQRLAVDNEVLAMSACGMSYRKVLFPAIMLGVVLFGVMGVLLDVGVPHFWTRMRQILANDVTKLFVASVGKGESLKIGDTQLYADEVRVVEGPHENGAETELLLAGVAAVEIGPDGQPATEFTAKFATVDVHRRNGSSYLKLALVDAMGFRSGDKALIYMPSVIPEAVDLGRGFRPSPRGMRASELWQLWNDPESYLPVQESRLAFERAFASCAAWNALDQESLDGTVQFTDVTSNRSYEIKNAQVVPGGIAPRDATALLQLTEFDRGNATRRTKASSAIVELIASEPGERALFELRVKASEVEDLRGIGAGGRWPGRVLNLAVDGSAAHPALSGASLPRMLEADAFRASPLAAGASGYAEQLAQRSAALARELEKTHADVFARFVQRVNQAFSAPLALLLGAVLAVRMRGALPLHIYMYAFIPAIACMLCISGGEQLVRGGALVFGAIIASLGNIVLLSLITHNWRTLARH